MSDQQSSLAQAGDPVPFCYGMAADRRFYSLEEQAGRAAVMVLIDRTSPSDGSVVEDLVRQSHAFAARDADVLILGNEDVVRALKSRVPAPLRLIDCGTDFLARCGALGGDMTVLVIDRNRRVAARLSPVEERDIAAACLGWLDRLPSEHPRDEVLPAPVLMLPNLLQPELCRTLIERFESGASIDGEVATIDTAGMVQSRINYEKKRRRDLLIPPEDRLHPILHRALLGRCAPEIARAFQATVAHTDRILVARYDKSGGWFRRHRDNLGENVAFREFAISVNLNTEEYEGGHLLFPEYNDHRYRPPTGAGIIFSASLLHEATPVARGRRYVLLTFFHGEAAEARRRDYVARSSGGFAPGD